MSDVEAKANELHHAIVFGVVTGTSPVPVILEALRAVRTEERERCAAVCERWAWYQEQLLAHEKEHGRDAGWFALTCEAEKSSAIHLAAAIRKEPGE